MTNLTPDSVIGKAAFWTVVGGALVVRTITYPVRYGWWRLRGNSKRRMKDNEPTIRL